jgi:signal transduction histidine kinase
MKPAPPEHGRDAPEGGLTRCAFTLDAARGVVVEATPQALALWGLQPAALPAAVDRAMPALRQLGRLPCGRPVRSHEHLTLWTRRGVHQVYCSIRRIGAGELVFAIEVLEDRGRAHAARRATANGMAPTQGEHMASARLAHELRTPLSAVIAYAEVLKDEHFGLLGNARYRDYARNIYDSARHALGVLEGMLAGSPDARGVPELVFADLDPRGVVEDCLAVARPLADEAGLALAAEFGPRMPRIVADEVSLKQMLLNLLTNAIKFARRGDQVTVAVAYEMGGPLRIAVTDTGPGMKEPPLALEGGRSGPGGRPKGGRGIGLPLTRALAEANGAALVIDSAPGRGTRVTIAFGKDRVVPV